MTRQKYESVDNLSDVQSMSSEKFSDAECLRLGTGSAVFPLTADKSDSIAPSVEDQIDVNVRLCVRLLQRRL